VLGSAHSIKGCAVLCYRCGGHVKNGSEKCVSCGQPFEPAQRGAALGFGAGIKRSRHAIEGAPCQPGEKIANRFEVGDFAAAGPLGWMYKATELNSEAAVALKILSPRFLQLPEEKKIFAEELLKAQKLIHPNIARIYDAGEDRGRPYVASQHLEGLTLRRIMELRRQKGQKFTLTEVEPIVAQIAAALDAARGAALPVAHGNLKPDNVIVLPDLLKLTDFGLAVSLPRAPFMAAQRAAGVHRYLAPEFLLGDPLDARTDVFSLGVLIGELLSGVPHVPQLNLLERNPELPSPVEALYRRAIAPRASARFATAGDLAAELSDLIAYEPRKQAQVPQGLEDAGDVLIVESTTDPRVRLARALDAVQPVSTPPVIAPFTPPPPYEPPPSRVAAEARAEETTQPRIDSATLAPPIAPIVLDEPTIQMDIIDDQPPPPAQPGRPRRGYAGKKKKQGARGRKSFASTEAAVAIGPVTAALDPITPEAPAAPAVSFAAIEAPPSNLRKYFSIGAALVVLAILAVSYLGSSKPAAEPAVAEAPKPIAVQAATPVAPAPDPVKPSLEQKVRSVRERAEKALQERAKKNGHAR
jgi:serine/threonine protein kinase